MNTLPATGKLDSAMPATHGNAAQAPATPRHGDSGFSDLLAIARAADAEPSRPASTFVAEARAVQNRDADEPRERGRAPDDATTPAATLDGTATPSCAVVPVAAPAVWSAGAATPGDRIAAAAKPSAMTDGTQVSVSELAAVAAPAPASTAAAVTAGDAAVGDEGDAHTSNDARAGFRARAADASAAAAVTASASTATSTMSNPAPTAPAAGDAALGTPPILGSAPAGAAFTAAQAGAAETLPGAATDATIAPDLRSPAFAPALGARVALLLRDGVREARLQVNPAGLGPVDVRIAVDGSLARVDLLAEHAPTRAALEQALPALAGALREAGLTLAGGGVFDAARDAGTRNGGGRPDGGTHDPGSRSGDVPPPPHDGITPDPARLAAVTATARGLVDVYA